MVGKVEVRGFPTRFSSLAHKLEEVGDSLLALCLRLVDSHGAAVDYGAIELEASEQLAAMEVCFHAAALSTLDVDAPRIRVWGKEYRRVMRCEGEYYCQSGPVRAERTLYRRLGERCGETVDAISLRTGAVADGWLPHTARAMAHLLARGTSREAADTSRELRRLPYSRSSFERVGHAVGAQLIQTGARVEAALIDELEVPEEATSVSVSIDRVSVPMEEGIVEPERNEERARELDAELAALPPRFEVSETTAAALAEAKQAVEKRRRKVERNFRMAYCATVTLHDSEGRGLHTIRYGRMPHGDVAGLMRGLARDVRALLAKRPELRVVFLADGAAELWNLYDHYLSEKDIGARAIRLVDFWHLVEYLGKAAVLMETRRRAGPGQLRRWKDLLLEQPGAGKQILAELEASGLSNVDAADGTKPVADALRYLGKRLRMARYASARSLGLPIGSGNVEATCKSLVGLRMKRPGSRWKNDTGEEVLRLRALYLSDRWPAGIRRALHPLRKPVKLAA
jgi:hypothetical protein